MYRTLFPRDLFAEFDRLQREVSSLFDASPAIRGLGRGGYPALNVGASPSSVEIYAFAPGLDPASIEVNLDRGVLSLAGERKSPLPNPDAKTSVHLEERFAGRFRDEQKIVLAEGEVIPDQPATDLRQQSRDCIRAVLGTHHHPLDGFTRIASLRDESRHFVLRSPGPSRNHSFRRTFDRSTCDGRTGCD